MGILSSEYWLLKYHNKQNSSEFKPKLRFCSICQNGRDVGSKLSYFENHFAPSRGLSPTNPISSSYFTVYWVIWAKAVLNEIYFAINSIDRLDENIN